MSYYFISRKQERKPEILTHRGFVDMFDKTLTDDEVIIIEDVAHAFALVDEHGGSIVQQLDEDR